MSQTPETILVSLYTEPFYIITEEGIRKQEGRRAYVAGLPELVFYYRPGWLTESRTGRKFAEAGTDVELEDAVRDILARRSKKDILAAIASVESLENK